MAVAAIGIVSAIFLPQVLRADKDSRGKEFWVAFPGNTANGANQLFLYLVSTGAADIDVDYAPAALGATPFHQHVTMTAAGQVVKVIVPSLGVGGVTAAQSADLQSSDIVEDKGIHVTSTSGSSEFAVYGFSNSNQTADAFLGLPVDVLGTEYFVASYPATAGSANSGSEFVVVGTQSGTSVTITPTVGYGSRTAGTPFTINLGAGNTYLGRAAIGLDDLTGTLIKSNKPVAVLSGNRCGNVPAGVNACDILLEQLPPTEAWGKKFLSVPFAGRLNGDRFRILGSVNGTTIKINGSAVATVNRGGFYETVLTSSSHITADQPVLVVQFEHSRNFDGGSPPSPLNDPSMMVLYPYEQYQQGYTISTPTGAGFDNINYVSLVAPDAAVGSVAIDGSNVPVASWTSISTSGFKAARVQLSTAGTHQLTGPMPFGVLAYGNGTDANGNGMVTTYAYPGGMAVAPVASVKTISITVTGGVKYVGEQICVTATAKDQAGAGVSGVRVDFTTSVTGAIDFQLTDSSGTTPSFCYTGTTATTSPHELVTGTVGTVFGTGTVQWLPRPVEPIVTAASRYYDGTTTATIASCQLREVAPSPGAGNLVPTATAGCVAAGPSTFSDKNSGTGKTVTAGGITVSGGTKPNNYVLSPSSPASATTTADIWPVPVLPLITAQDKPYDGNTNAILTSQTLVAEFNNSSASPYAPIVAGEAPFLALNVGGASFDNKNVGTGKLVTGTGLTLSGSAAPNYVLDALSAVTTAAITPVPLTATITANNKQYDGTTAATISACAIGGLISPDVVTCAAASGAFNNKNVGLSKPVTLSGFTVGGPDLGNYTAPAAPAPVADITPKLLTATATASSKIYDGNTLTTVSGCALVGVIAGDTVTCSVDSTGNFDNKNKGTGKTVTVTGYALNGADKNNYSLPAAPTATANIDPRPLTITAGNQSKTYGDAFAFAGNEFTTLGLVTGVGDAVTGATLSSAGQPVTATVAGSTYPILVGAATGTGLDNYTISYVNGAMTVSPKPLVITATSQTKLYGDLFTFAGTEFGSPGLINGDTVSGVTLSSAGTPVTATVVGSPYAIVPSAAVGTGLGNYSISYVNGQLAVTPRALTIKAQNQSKVYGNLFSFAGTEFTTAGLVNGDTVASALLASASGSPVTATVAGSPYAIAASDAVFGVGAAANYSITYAPGNLAVTPRPITVTADPKSKIYGDADPSLTYSITSGALVNGDTLAGALTRGAGENVGTYPIQQGSLGANGNYALTYVSANLLIDPRPVTVTAANQTKNYGYWPGNSLTPAGATIGAGQTLFSANGLVGTDAIATVTLATAGAPPTSPVAGSPYSIVASAAVFGTGLASNYTVSYADGTLTINRAPLTITANNQSKTYGDTFSFAGTEFSVSGLVDGSVTGVTLTSGATPASAGVGGSPYAITPTAAVGTGLANYVINYVDGAFTINPRPLTITANDRTKQYGDAVVFAGTEFAVSGLVNGNTVTSTTLNSVGAAANAAVSGSPYDIVPSAAVFGSGNAADYSVSYVNGKLFVNPRAITVTADPKTKIYGDGDPALTYHITTGSLVGSETLIGALTRAGGENVGPYAIQRGSLSGGGNYTLTFVGSTLTVDPKPLTITAASRSKMYGNVATFAGTEFTTTALAFSDAVTSVSLASAGAPAAATIAGSPYPIVPSSAVFGPGVASNYAITYADGQLTITPRSVSVRANDKTKVYGDSDPALDYSITGGSLLSGDSFTGNVSRASGENVADYAIGQGTLALNANYSLSFTAGNFSITPRPLTITASDRTKQYGDVVNFAGTEFTTSGLVTGDTVGSATLTSAGAPANAAVSGSPYDIIPSAAVFGTGLASNYTVTYSNGKLFVNPRALTVTADPKSKIYGDADPALTYQITTGSLVGTETLSGGLMRIGGENIGPYGIGQGTLSGGGNYTLTFVGSTLTIDPKPLTITAANRTKMYGNVAAFAGTEFTTTALAFTDAVTSVSLASAGAPAAAIAGSPYAITPSAAVFGPGVASNYAITYVDGQLTIIPRNIAVKANDKTKVYGDGDPALDYAITGGTLLAGDSFTGNVSRAAGEDVGAYAIGQGSLALNANYSLSFTGGNFQITPRPLTITASDRTKEYGDVVTFAGTEFTTAGLAAGDTITSATLTSAGAPANAPVSGSPYDIVPSAAVFGAGAASNYSISYINGRLTVNARPITVTADPKTKVYGNSDPGLTYQVTAGSLVAGDAFTGALTRIGGEPVGSYAIQQGTLALTSSYAITFVGANLEITPRPLTIKADNATKNYGDELTFGGDEFTSTGLVFADTVTRVNLVSSGQPYNASVGGSPYVIVASGAVGTGLGNYSINYVNGQLTIIPRPVTIKANPLTKIYGDLDPPLSFQITSGSLLGGDFFTGGLTRTPGQNVGTYAIQQGSVTLGPSYVLTFVSDNLTINPRPITIKANDRTKNYGDAVTFAGTEFAPIANLAGTDAVLTVTLISAGAPASAPVSGSPYDIAPSAAVFGSGLATNYAITYANGKLTVNPRALTVAADPKTKIYGDGDPALTYQIAAGALFGSDALNGSPTRVAGENVGPYAIQQGTLSGGANYTLTFVPSTLTIDPKPLTITAADRAKQYGDEVVFAGTEFTTSPLAFTDAISTATLTSAGAAANATIAGSPYDIAPSAPVFSTGSASNYAINYVNGRLTITPRPVVVKANDKTKVYGDADPALDYTVMSGSLLAGDSFSGNVSRGAGENVGDYVIGQGTLALSANYSLSFTAGNFHITPRRLTVTALDQAKQYGDAVIFAGTEFASTGLAFSDTLASATITSAGAPATAPVSGSPYDIVPSDAVFGTGLAGNYDIHYVNGTLTVNRRAITVTADPKTKIYGDADPALTYQVTAGSLVAAETLSGALTRVTGENIGPYAIQQGTLSGGGNYTLTFVGSTLTINPRPLTITASDRTKQYGDEAVFTGFEFTSTPLAFSDALATVTLTSAGAPANAAIVGSPYDIAPSAAVFSSGVASNYAISYANGKLTITARPISVKANDKTKVYGDADPGLDYSLTSGALLPGDSFTGNVSRAAGENVGDYVIGQGTLVLSGNYSLSFAAGNFAITPRPLTVTAADRTKNFGDEVTFAGTEFTTTPLAFSDTVATVSLASAGAPAAATAPGPYDIDPSNAVFGAGLASNYSITYAAGHLTLTAPALAVTKSVDKATAAPGDQLVYTISYSNTGNGDATGVVVTDDVPARTVFAGASHSGALSGGSVAWNLGTVAAHASGSVTMTVTLNSVFPAGTTPVVNTAVYRGTNLSGCTVGCTAPPVETQVTAAPRLAVSKTVNEASALPGGTLHYVITVTNTGNASASDVDITDVIPSPSIDFVQSIAAQDGGQVTANGATWSNQSIQAGGTLALDLNVTLKGNGSFPAGVTHLTNGVVAQTTEDPNCATGCRPTTPPDTTVTVAPHLTVNKTVDKATAQPGDTLTYTITVSNDGTAAATGVNVTDTLPANTMPFVMSIAPQNGGSTAANGATWSNQTVPLNGALTLTMSVVLKGTGEFPAGVTTLTNTVVAQTPQDPNCATGCGDPEPPTTTVTVAPHLTVNKTVDKGTAQPGETLTYTITVRNDGTAAATGVDVTDTLPASTMPFVASIAAQNAGTPTANGASWSNQTVPVNGALTLTMTVVLKGTGEFPAGVTTLTNTVVAQTPQDPNCAAGCGDPEPPTTTVTVAPHLTVNKTVDKGTAQPGDTLIYTITVRNDGTAAATGVNVTDTLPAATMPFVASIAAQNGGTPTANGASWSSQTVPVNGTLTLTMSVVLKGTGQFPAGVTTLTNTVVAQTPQDPNCSNGCGDPEPPTTTVAVAPKLTVNKTVDKATAAPGDTLTYTITINNTGGAAATGVSVADTLPAGTMPFVASIAAQDGGTPTANGASWSNQTVPVNGALTLTMTVVLKGTGQFPAGVTTLTNTVVAQTPQDPNCATGCGDPEPPTTTVTVAPKLTVNKIVDKATAAPGDTLTYTITVTNAGDAAATGVNVTDTLPAGTMPFVASIAAQDGGTSTANGATWTNLTVPVNGSATLHLTVALKGVGGFPAGVTHLTNGVVAQTPDDPSCLTGCEPATPPDTTVTVAPHLTVSKTVAEATAQPGGTLHYQITIANDGSADATGVTVTDTIPAASAAFVDSVGAANANSVTSTGASWTNVLVPVNGSVTLNMTVVLKAAGAFPAGVTHLTNGVVAQTPQDPQCLTGCEPATPPDTTVTVAPKLTVNKSVDKATAAPGDTLTYTITINNTGDAAATGVDVADTLPAATMPFVASIAAHNGGTSTANGAIWSNQTVPVGGNLTLTLTVVLKGTGQFPAGVTTLVNTVVAQTPQDPNCAAGCSDPEPPTTTVTVAPKLTVNKIVDKAAAAPGDTLTYTITVSNAGDAAATGVNVIDELPAATMPFVASIAAQNGGTPTANGAAWSNQTVPVGGNLTLTMTVVLKGAGQFPSGVTTLINTVVAQTPQDPNCATGCGDPEPPTTTVAVAPKLTITKTVAEATAQPGGVLHYTVTVANTGNANATDVDITDVIPSASMTYVQSIAPLDGGVATANGATWMNQSVAVGGTLALHLNVTLKANGSFPAGVTHVTNGVVAKATEDPACAVKCEPSTPPDTTVSVAPKLTISKTVAEATAQPGGVLHYTVTVANTGNANATDVDITDVIPSTSMSYVQSIAALDGGVATANGATWMNQSVAVGGTLALHLNVTLKANGSFPAGVTHLTNGVVAKATEDPACAVKCEPATPPDTTVSVAPKLTITKTVAEATAQPGDVLHYTVTVANTGDANATDVDITDVIPSASMSYVQSIAALDGGVATANGATWMNRTVAVGGTLALHLNVTLKGESSFPAGVTHLTNSVVAQAAEDPACAVKCEPATPPDTTVSITFAKVTIRKISVGGVGTFTFTNTVPGGATTLTTATAGTAVGATSTGVPMGTYTMAETVLPAGWAFTSVACTGGGANTTVSGQTVTIGADAGEDIVCTFTNTKSAGYLASGDTATIGYWQNKNGQALILAMNGGGNSTAFANYLASYYPYLYGPQSANNLTNKKNADVAALFIATFKSDKTMAQVMANAIATYVTNSSLAGGNFSGSYGFNVSTTGTGAKLYNVGSLGTAIGLQNNKDYTIAQILAQANIMKAAGAFNAGAFNTICEAINSKGDIK